MNPMKLKDMDILGGYVPLYVVWWQRGSYMWRVSQDVELQHCNPVSGILRDYGFRVIAGRINMDEDVTILRRLACSVFAKYSDDESQNGIVEWPGLWPTWRSRGDRSTMRVRRSASLPWQRVKGNAPYLRHDCGDAKHGRAVCPHTAVNGRDARSPSTEERVFIRNVPLLLQEAYFSRRYCNVWQYLPEYYCSTLRITTRMGNAAAEEAKKVIAEKANAKEDG